MKRIGIFLIVTLAGCAGFQADPGRPAAELVEAVNLGRINRIEEALVVPFLLDGEIVVLKASLLAFWEAAVAGGFRLEGETQVQPGRPEDYSLWGTSREVELFFKKYLPPGAFYVVRTEKHLLLISYENGKLRFHGMKG